MTEIRDRTFNSGEIVDTDGVRFVGCRFNGATVRYSGGDHPFFEECIFDGLSWYFDGPALKTIQLLQGINNQDGSEVFISEMFKKGVTYGA